MMNKYYIIIESTGRNNFQVDLEDNHGDRTTVYEKTIEEAMTYAKNWCKDADDRKRRKEITNKAIQEMIALDRMAGITTATSDGLD